jgi:hypothetical protein
MIAVDCEGEKNVVPGALARKDGRRLLEILQAAPDQQHLCRGLPCRSARKSLNVLSPSAFLATNRSHARSSKISRNIAANTLNPCAARVRQEC